tara:strand:- start:360 stop:1310 length:951 start_codon:yes stop_codon:yes gene_type:complete
MNQLTEQTEFDDETVAEALANSSNTEPDNDDGFEIEIIDDTPAKTEDESSKDENSESGDEVEKYSVGVQKRIDKLTKQYREEERARQEAGRLQEEALRFAQQVKTENDQLRKTLSEGEGVLVNQAKGRVTAELDKAKSAFKVAYEAGDPDALLDAQEKLNSLQGEKMRYDNYRPQPQRAEPAPQPQYQAPAPQPPRPDNRAMDWASKNEWFEQDPEMTGYAYGLHEKLVKSGIDPRTEEYYNEIDNAVRRVFPDKFDDVIIEESAPQRQAGNVVAPAARSGKRPRKVQLTSTQVSLAKRLGLSNEVYAAQLMKEMK